VVSAQNHDQIGNRSQGERLSMMLGVAQLKAIAALTILSPFVPMLFQGEEWGASTPFLYFTDHENNDLGRLVAEGRSKEFSGFRWQGAVPNPQEAETFTRSKLNWAELSQPPHAMLFDWYRRLIQLRRDKLVEPREALSAATKAVVKFNAEAAWLNFSHNGVLVMLNLGTVAQIVPMPKGEWHLVLSSDSLQAPPAQGMAAETTHIYIGHNE
jgi:maltooligosyltrehalose trehalohydrolase